MTAYLTPEPITATLTTAGALVRIAASDRTDTVVHVEPVDGANKSNVKVAEGTKVGFSDGELSIKTTKSGDKNGSVAITIELPAGSRLILNSATTDVHAAGPLGDCELNISSGQVRLDRVSALRANLAAGEVEIGRIAGTADIEGGSAGVRIGEAGGVVKYEGSTGKVWIGHARSDVELGGSGGGFDIDHAEGDVLATTGNCPIRIGRMTRGQANLTNAGGGIEVGVSEGSSALVDAKSTKGTVRSTLPVQDRGRFDEQVTIHARTRLDDIVIRPVAVA
ncbi:DUF4097 family beta strand repeat-containing protein [Amycolatopsis regifaucium]|uniref:DUF4097 domain-containing protein n=1 Tax=Amycolatopsis regifaucium TaxID=546365 RepID=A0A154MB28_9PSEU|nr:DUF4097 family beta strand repeat-containing protein [Amycolatopsis regifaucium]KZB81487.1 hypothetical protein AVL48_05615 [Amycolatopsis regifaucium]OKA06943.1 hypothetical protein ATP06_0220685 [Amycolatopsis regifaucium]SFH30105.1 hypothetical protein SAMN04489731_103424 [Amycolatopsis regifaucium]